MTKMSLKKPLVLLMCLSLVLTAFTFNGNAVISSAKKAPALSSKKLTLKVGVSKKLKIKNAPKKYSATWTSKNKKIAKVNKKGKVTAVKAGKTKVICKLNYKQNGKKFKKTLKATVVVNAADAGASTTAPAAATAPAVATPVVTPAAPASVPAVTEAPIVTETPAVSSTPKITDTPIPLDKEHYQTSVSANFNPENFDANEIVESAKNAGMKYIVITSKHHEGFSMWDTKVESFTTYDGSSIYSLQAFTKFGETGRDLLMELKTACEEAGLKFGLYYSIIDWNHLSQPGIWNGGFTFMASEEARTAYINDMKAQLKELVDTYDPDILWFDGDWDWSPAKAARNIPHSLKYWWTNEDGQELCEYVKSLNTEKTILVNERVCRDFGLGDFDCPENSVPKAGATPDRLWETCRSMNDAWGYKEASENNYLTSTELITEYIQVVSRGGNYLLNIGPKGDGSMTENQKDRLSSFGNWMLNHSDSIYNTSPNPFVSEPEWGTYTVKDNNLYAHIINWPEATDGAKTITVSIPEGLTVNEANYMEDTSETVDYKVNSDNTVTVTLPDESIDDYVTVIDFTLSDKIDTSETNYEVPDYMEWWEASKFGMFIHLGSYSELAKGEWDMVLDPEFKL